MLLTPARNYRLTLGVKNNHFMFIDDIKAFTQNEKELEVLIQTI